MVSRHALYPQVARLVKKGDSRSCEPAWILSAEPGKSCGDSQEVDVFADSNFMVSAC